MDGPYQVKHNFKVSIRLQDNTKAIKQINSGVFAGVSPSKTTTRVNNRKTVKTVMTLTWYRHF
jgi:hypothetical protein